MVGNRELLEDVIGRITPEDYKGDWAKYKEACKAAADHGRVLLAAMPDDANRFDALRQVLKAALPIRNEWAG